DNYLDWVVLHKEGQRLGLTVTDDEAEKDAMENLAKVVREKGGEDKFNESLEQAGISQDAVLWVLRAQGRNTVMARRVCVAERETPEGRARFAVKVREAYERGFGEKVDARHFFIPVKAGTPEEGPGSWADVVNLAKDLRNQLAKLDD